MSTDLEFTARRNQAASSSLRIYDFATIVSMHSSRVSYQRLKSLACNFEVSDVANMPLLLAEAFMVAANRQHWMPMLGGLPAEEAFIEADRWLLDRVGDFASLPSVPLGFLDELAGYAMGLVLRVEEMVESSVAVRLLTFDRVKCGRCKSLEDTVRVLEFAVLAVREWQYLLRRYLPQQGNVAPTTSMAEQGVSAFLSNLRALLTFSRN
jgi:hypothetical protein